MLQVLLILCIGSMVAHDALPRSLRGDSAGGGSWDWGTFGLVAGSTLALALVTHAIILRGANRLDATGSVRYVFRAERAVTFSRLAAAGLHVWFVFSLGWVGCVRGAVGDLPAIDEILTLCPFLASLCAGWASFYMIDRRLREASLMGVLDSPQPVMTLPTTWQYVSDQLRHQVLILLAPMIGITAWSEATILAAHAAAEKWPHLFESTAAQWTLSGVQFAGVIIVLVMMPLGLRLVWKTSRLGEGPLRARLTALCEKQRVRCRDFLVWHSHTGMVNGALVGFLPCARYILLTDALLERMTEREVEAVMAHEVGHAARRHIPWMAASVIVTATLANALLTWVGPHVLPAWAYLRVEGTRAEPALLIGPEFPLSMILGFLVFGMVSRRFERQADAFAAQHLSGWSARRNEPQPPPAILPDAAQAMADALTRVARLAHLDESRFTFRHGSIAARKRNVLELVGTPANGIAADRASLFIKAIAAAGILVVLTLITLGW